MTKKTEMRSVSFPLEVRAASDGAVKIGGHAAVFDEEADIGGVFREKIVKGAFKKAINRDDVVLLVNHGGLPLARTGSRTLTLKEDDTGLRMDAELDASDPDVMAVVPKMKRGDLSHMSFQFRMKDGKEEWDDTGDIPLRTITEFGSIQDVSVVTFPAYEGTDVGLRSLDEYRNEVKRKNFHAARTRLRMKKDLAERTA